MPASLYAFRRSVICWPVPVVYFVGGDSLVVPIDTVKPKSSPVLQRQTNLDADPRATLLVDHWDHGDWSQLWWVRAELPWQGTSTDLGSTLAAGLVGKYPQYVDAPFHHLMVFTLESVSGWSARG